MSDVLEEAQASLAALPAIDQHCHSLLARWSELGGARPAWRRCFTEAVRPASIERDVVATRGYIEFLRAMASFQGDAEREPVGLEGRVVRQRAVAIGTEPDRYAQRLFDDAGISMLLVDTGYGTGTLTVEELSATVDRPALPIVRVESVAERCLAARRGTSITGRGFTDALVRELDQALSTGAIGLKSIAAYRAGLDLPEPSAAQLTGALRRLDRDAQARRLDDPVIVASVVWTAARFAAERMIPLQVHVGFGDEDVHLPAADPTLLRPLLRDPALEACNVVLLHGHPFVEQAAYLATVFPQVHLDLSLTIPILGGAAAERAIASALAACPTTKLLAGSDGHSHPEMHWRGLRLWRQALGRVLAGEVAAGRMDPSEVEPIARDILAGNARRLYRLPLDT